MDGRIRNKLITNITVNFIHITKQTIWPPWSLSRETCPRTGVDEVRDIDPEFGRSSSLRTCTTFFLCSDVSAAARRTLGFAGMTTYMRDEIGGDVEFGISLAQVMRSNVAVYVS